MYLIASWGLSADGFGADLMSGAAAFSAEEGHSTYAAPASPPTRTTHAATIKAVLRFI